MVNEVGKIIRNTLLVHGAVHLPSVGTLYIIRKGAAIVGKERVVAPEYRIEYSSNREAISVIDAIVESASIEKKGAEDIYMLWLDKARKNGEVEIFSVGILRNKSFVADEELIMGINPDKGNLLTITKQRSKCGRVALYITAAVMLIAIAAGAYIYLNANNTKHPQSVSNESTQPIIADNNVDENVRTIIQTDSLDNTTEVAEVVEIIDKPQIEDTRPWIERDDIMHYVIYGSYSRKRNAEREATQINDRELDGVVSKTIVRGKMYSVAIFGSTALEECEAFIIDHKAEFPQAWVYSIEEN